MLDIAMCVHLVAPHVWIDAYNLLFGQRPLGGDIYWFKIRVNALVGNEGPRGSQFLSGQGSTATLEIDHWPQFNCSDGAELHNRLYWMWPASMSQSVL